MADIDIISKWYAELYDREETQTDDVDFMLSVIGSESKNVLEVCCGSGRILVPLAKAGHNATGIDIDNGMLERISAKAKGLSNICSSKADAVTDDWGSNFDIVILAGNILLNIASDMDYKEAQRLFVKKSYDCLKPGGHLYIDFDCHSYPEKIYVNPHERIVFEGVDSCGNYGKEVIFDGKYDMNTRLASFKRRREIITKDGERVVRESNGVKHIPTLSQVHEWLSESGFRILGEYGDYRGNPISETTHKAVMWAEKVK